MIVPVAAMKRVLVTGAGSFSARHLLPLLASLAGAPEVFATDARAAGPRGMLETVPDIIPGAAPVAPPFRPADLTDSSAARMLIEWARPDTVFHLAGVSATDAATCFAVNLGGTKHLLEACMGSAHVPAVLLVSSASVYGLTAPEESPVGERTPLRPLTPYGASKAAAELFALTLHRRGELNVAVARPFNLIGPGLRPGLAPSDFMAQALAIRAGRAAPEIRVGNLEPRRDFVDVRDAVRAYAAIVAQAGCFGEAWNVASGRPVSIRALLEAILAASGVQASIHEDAARLRPIEVMEQVGDVSALARATGWSATVPLEQSLRDMAGAA